MSTRNKEYVELLKHKFDEEKFIVFITDLLNLESSDLNKNLVENTSISKQYIENIEYYKHIANYNDNMNSIGVFVVKLANTSTTKARNMQRNFVASLLSKYNLDASLVAFFSEKETSWRLSFVKKELSFTDKGVKENLTSAKRYSYLVGENESVHTAQEFLFHLLEIDDRKISLDDIEKQFDVEKVTNRFFEEYKNKYIELKGFLDNNIDFQTEAKNCDFDSTEFAKKLMGQIVFLYFLQKKGWLGVQLIPNELSELEYNDLLLTNDNISQNLIKSIFDYQGNKYIVNIQKIRNLDSEDVINISNVFIKTKYNLPWGTGKKDFMRFIFEQAKNENKNFFDDYLEPFFYKGLNEKRENQFFSLFNCKIPFLNGGLFEPLNNYRWSSAHFEVPNSLFSNDKKEGILDFLDLYNFTIDEEEPLEKDIAVDPEMLGKIFEKLLDNNNENGTFYTPRDIVYFMCQESLAKFISNKVNVDYDEILYFIKNGDIISQYDLEKSDDGVEFLEIGKSVFNNIMQIDDALANIKIADPAVGSGAFPLGMLTEIVKLRNNLQTYMIIQSELNLINLDDYNNSNHFELDTYNMKLQTIENSIYAVDIETSAIDIAKLRLWLSLIVDYPNENEPRPLPNLDCKIMQGNSLLDEFDGVVLFSEKMIENNLKGYRRNDTQLSFVKDIHIQQTLFDETKNLNQYIENMLELQKEYFRTSDNRLKKDLKEKIDSIQMGMVEETLSSSPKKLQDFKREAKKRQKPWFIWKLEFYDVFKNNGGFDIVIGNPPYGANIDNYTKQYEKKYPETSKGYKDIYKYFINIALKDLLVDNGILCYITPNTYFKQPRYKDVRELMLDYPIIKLVNLGSDVFDATVLTAIMLVENSKYKNSQLKYSDLSDNSKYIGSIKNVKYEEISQACFKANSDLSFVKPLITLKNDEDYFENVIKPKDAGINYQRVNVGLSEKGKSDLSDRLLYEGTKQDEKDIEYWKGVDIEEFKVSNSTNRFCRPYIQLRDNERVILNKEYFENINPKILWRQTAPYPIACVDYEGIWFGRSIQSGIISEKYIDMLSEEYICCILNSKYIRYLYIKSVEEIGRVFPQVKLEKLKNLPIKIISKDNQNEFIDLYNKIKQADEIEKQTLKNILDDKIYKLYNLDYNLVSEIEKYFNDLNSNN